MSGHLASSATMLKIVSILLTVVALSVGALAQSTGPVTTNPANGPASETTPTPKDANAASEQTTKPVAAKTSTIIGCLSGRGPEGHYVLSSMQYRSGIDVSGPDDLQTAAGQKVKLTGQWLSSSGPQAEAAEKKQRQFQAASFDVMADTCSLPTETTPISKKKQQQKKAASQNSGNNPH